MTNDQADREATAFAMELLMPEQFIRAELSKSKSFDLMDTRALKKLADKFRVEPQIMAIRIGQLGMCKI